MPVSPSPPSWDGDAAGLICGYVFEPGAALPARSMNLDAARGWIEARATSTNAGGAFLWLHFNLSHAPARAWLERHAPLPDSFHEALREPQPSTRVERADDMLLAIINDVHFDFGFEPSDISTLWVAVGPQLVVSARTRPLRSIDVLRTAVRAGHAPASSTELFEQLMRAQADALVGIVRSVTARIDSVEDALLAGRLDQQRARLGGLRRVLVRLQRLLAPEPAALFRLL
ncbi:MAG: magnesium transporter CorA, partial [Comamonadaceae bacterium]